MVGSKSKTHHQNTICEYQIIMFQYHQRFIRHTKLLNIMKITSLFALLLLPTAYGFAPQASCSSSCTSTVLYQKLSSSDENLSRRDALFQATAAATLTFLPTLTANADETVTVVEAASAAAMKNIVVAGATGQTGSRIYNKLRSQPSFSTTGGVRNIAKASKSLATDASTLAHIDVVEDSLESLTSALNGADGLIIACGMNPGKNLLRMNAAAHEVDNVGTIKLIQAAQAAKVQKVVLVSSILTNGRAWGQEDSPGFKITNAFGNALDEKLAAEQYLRSSGLDYTIVRPGGLQGKAPVGALLISKEDTLNSGEISRDLVADVCIASLNDEKVKNKVIEIIEDDGTPPKVFNGLNM